MATTSAARIAANRQNAQRSTGPKTAAGKARARANAVKHGLTGAGIAVPGEDAAILAARFLDLQEEMAPSGLEGALLVRQMALSSLRIDRAAQQEAAALALVARHAAIEFDLAQAAEVERLFDALADNPSEHRRRLLTTPTGIDLILHAFEAIRDQVESGAHQLWEDHHRSQIEALFGGTFGAFPIARVGALLLALAGDFLFIPPRDLTDVAADDRPRWAATALIDRIDTESARLQTIRAGLDPTILSTDRDEAAPRALFDPPPALLLARKYEAAALRTFQRSQRDFYTLGLADQSTPESADETPESGNRNVEVVASIPDQAPIEVTPAPDVTPAEPVLTVEIAPPTDVVCSNEPNAPQPPVVDPRVLHYLHQADTLPSVPIPHG